MELKLLDQRIKALNKKDAKAALKVVASNTVAAVLKEAAATCSYECCPCHSKTPNQCGCEGYCTCGKFGKGISMELMSVYESLREADDATLKRVVAKLHAAAGVTP